MTFKINQKVKRGQRTFKIVAIYREELRVKCVLSGTEFTMNKELFI